jgi:hypothetical protein
MTPQNNHLKTNKSDKVALALRRLQRMQEQPALHTTVANRVNYCHVIHPHNTISTRNITGLQLATQNVEALPAPFVFQSSFQSTVNI